MDSYNLCHPPTFAGSETVFSTTAPGNWSEQHGKRGIVQSIRQGLRAKVWLGPNRNPGLPSHDQASEKCPEYNCALRKPRLGTLDFLLTASLTGHDKKALEVAKAERAFSTTPQD
jgi:hypothetical protein